MPDSVWPQYVCLPCYRDGWVAENPDCHRCGDRSKRVPCGRCGGSGVFTAKRIKAKCELCEGRGSYVPETTQPTPTDTAV